MKKLKYSIEIQATPQQVHATMLGLNDKKTYEQWTAAFNPTSTFEGSWDKGSKIQFIGTDENGDKGGMVSRIIENTPGKFVSIQHNGIIEKGVEITEGPKVEGWAGANETYTFEPTNNGTKLTVELDAVEEYADYFNETYPKALEKLKEVCEESIAKRG